MKRLTYKNSDFYVSCTIDYNHLFDLSKKEWNDFEKLISKVGKMEDMEEELNMSFEDILKIVYSHKEIFSKNEKGYRMRFDDKRNKNRNMIVFGSAGSDKDEGEDKK